MPDSLDFDRNELGPLRPGPGDAPQGAVTPGDPSQGDPSQGDPPASDRHRPAPAATVPQTALIRRLRRAASGNVPAPEGVTLRQAQQREVMVGAHLTLSIDWATEVEVRLGAEMVRFAIYCRNAAELNATLARDLDAEAASLETAHRFATLLGPLDERVEAMAAAEEPLPPLPSLRGPYYLHEVCSGCNGGGVRACGGDGCRGGKIRCTHSATAEAPDCPDCGGRGQHRCPVCAGDGVVACESCGGVGQFTHIHHPRLTAHPSYSLTAPPDAPAAVRMALEEAGFAGFAALANPAPATVRHSGTQLLYQRSGTLTVVALSWECDGVPFEVETVGPDGDSAPLPPFLDTVLAPVLERIAALSPADAFALAGAYRLTRSVAEAVLDGREPDAAAIVADHEGCVSPAFVNEIAAVLAGRFAETSRTAVARSWVAAAGLLALVLLLVAGVDGPALLTGATPEQPAPAWLRLGWDIGLPVAAGLGLWMLVRGVVRGALGAVFGGPVRAPDQGSWPLVLLSAAAVLHLGLLTLWNGGPGFSRLNHRLDVEAITEGRAPLPAPRVLTTEERIMAAQRALARLGRYDGAIDGKMGEGTRTGLASLTGLIDTPPGVAPEDPLDLAVAIAADRVAVNVRTPELLVGPGWSNATRLRMSLDDQAQVAGAFLGALAASGTERASMGQEWMSGDRLRSGVVTVTGRIADPKDRGRLCFGLTHVVTTPAGRDAGTPLRTCRTAGNWTLEE